MKRHMLVLLFLVSVLTAGEIEAQVNWTPLSPAKRCCMGMAANVSADSPASETLLFGGFDGSSYFADTWILKQGRWIQAAPSNSPSARQGPGMAYDAATDTVVLLGGTAADGSDLRDIWIWNGQTWTQVLPMRAPSGCLFDTQGMITTPLHRPSSVWRIQQSNGPSFWRYLELEWTNQNLDSATPDCESFGPASLNSSDSSVSRRRL